MHEVLRQQKQAVQCLLCPPKKGRNFIHSLKQVLKPIQDDFFESKIAAIGKSILAGQ